MKRKDCVAGKRVLVKNYLKIKGVTLGLKAEKYIGQELTIYRDDGSSTLPIWLEDDDGNSAALVYPKWIKPVKKGVSE